MRLLNTKTYKLTHFVGELPEYAILSHRWEAEEVTFEDMKLGDNAKKKRGYTKLKNGARLAKDQGYQYIWIDTCCIDKSSSAELSEAINSMFQWYKNSARCFAYLSDISTRNMIHNSQWFKRGWTLQELIAPRHVHFFSKTWEFLGDKRELKEQLYSITGITQDVLLGANLSTIAASCKMSWAAERVTTRPEDMAYCLMGLFDVNIPLIYGEGGEKAFRRLQEQFIRESDDESIFAWTANSAEVAKKPYWGLLATSPSYFKNSARYTIPCFKTYRNGHSTEITNCGMRISLMLWPLKDDKSRTQFLAPLNCSLEARDEREVDNAFVIILQQLSEFEEQYARVRPDMMMPINFEEASEKSDLLKTSYLFTRVIPRETDPVAGFYVRPKETISVNFPVKSWKREGTPGYVDARFDYGDWKVGYETQTGRTFFIDLRRPGLGLDPRKFDVRNLRQRKAIGCIGVTFRSRLDKNAELSFAMFPSQPWESTYLIVGFEALPLNPLGTPPGYVKPWYSFQRGDSAYSVLSEFKPQDPLDLFATVPKHTVVGIRFTATTYMMKTFYRISLAPRKDLE